MLSADAFITPNDSVQLCKNLELPVVLPSAQNGEVWVIKRH